ncbi:MAG TPA: hypothetical protein DIW81_00030, partial [Planctomycetaceae bacterium]|nr:hypothetical protein [Planctomycetaceae bacterium]
MQIMIRLLMVIITTEIVCSGYWAAQQLGQYVPVLPEITFDDPLLAAELKALAETARQGESQD